LRDQPVVYNKTEPQPEVSQKKEPEPVTERPKMFVPNAGTASTSVKIPSLKDLNIAATAVLEEEDPYLKGDDKEDFTADDFLKHWNDYANKIKTENGNKSLNTIFIANTPVMLEPNRFEVVVGNKSQETLFRDEKPNILNYLRTKLKNGDDYFDGDVFV